MAFPVQGTAIPRFRIFQPDQACGTRTRTMASTKHWVTAAVAFMLMSGCISNPVPRGAVLGALSGAVLGAGTGLLISDEKLLGSTRDSKLPLGKGESMVGATATGVVIGAIVGAMIAHQRETGKPEASGSAATAQAAAPRAF